MARIRPKLSYANVMATIAVFLALGGGAAAALKLKANSVGSKQIKPDAVQGVDANEATFGQVPSAATANTANTANGVSPDAVGPAGIQNPTRSLNLPLSSFVLDGGQLSFAFNDGGPPGLSFGPNQLAIEWDDDSDGGGTNVADTGEVLTNFVVPRDYASGGSVALAVAKSGDAGISEAFDCFAYIDNVPGAHVTTPTTSGSLTTYVVSLPGAFAPGASVELSCFFLAGTGPANAFDDVVWLEGAEFRYAATQ